VYCVLVNRISFLWQEILSLAPMTCLPSPWFSHLGFIPNGCEGGLECGSRVVGGFGVPYFNFQRTKVVVRDNWKFG
jgi:hypothetical protein